MFHQDTSFTSLRQSEQVNFKKLKNLQLMHLNGKVHSLKIKVKAFLKCRKLSLYSKKKLLLPPLSETGPLNYEKTNRVRNTKLGTQIVFSMKMCKMSSSKIKDLWGPP